MVVHIQFVRFLLVGAVNTLFGYSGFALLLWLGLHHPQALTLATAVGILFNFGTTGRLVFANQGWHLLPRFFIGYGVAYGVNLTLLNMLVATGLSAYLTQLTLLPAIVVLSFVINKVFVFRSPS
ncbi:MAG: GtrA family protein [Alphaproteobacteria bacterium]|nr:GtrA family protein [Alphaproteobacteria bacterium]